MLDKRLKGKIDGIIFGTDIEVVNENSNKDGGVIPVQRDFVAGMISKEYALTYLIPEEVTNAHTEGLIHFHDLDYSPLFPMFNCMLIDLEGMFKKGFKIGNTEIEEPKSFSVACQVTSQIIAQVSSHIYGGTTINGIDRILAPYVKISFKKHFLKAFKWVRGEQINAQDFEQEFGSIEHDNEVVKEKFNNVWIAAKELTEKEVYDGAQSLEYEVNTLYTSNGQTPFITFGIDSELSWEGREIQKAIFLNRYKGIGKEGKTAIFPKLVYALEEGNNLKPEDPNYDIKLLAIKCSAKRLYPDIVSKPLIREITGDFKFPMGCRSFLGTYTNEDGKRVTDGRMNLGVVSLNLPKIAIRSEGNEEMFFSLLDEALDLAYKGLQTRIGRFKTVTSDVAPILYQQGATGFRLPAHTPIHDIFKNGFASVSLGYIGIHETIISLYGKKLWGNEDLHHKALDIVRYLRAAVDKWRNETGYGFSLYSTPSESLCHRFCKIDQDEFGIIPGVTDKGYYTNSFHLSVEEAVTPFEKIKFESEYPQLASGGFISFVEVNSLINNPEALEMIWDYAYSHVPYFGVNTPSDKCFECRFEGEFEASIDGYKCPNCGNNNPSTVSVIRRCCGYLSEPSDRAFNKGKQIEVTKRVKHL
ncbi:anaerobic ribonucleoside-triphosphate reductase [Brevibacillus daliensis]|uniref:anaerobic ribonucleoside-triphosphate reductase n=1 Tax=Brevibacillus daliensis TaxID=2892995 RepID=UPI001E4D1C69|nr:anaerobic ribonucleoside-triphosphate reductase [Brevibacillus daliensis]